MENKIHLPTPFNKISTTPPPKILDLKFQPASGYSDDGDIMNFDFIELNFLIGKVDKSVRSASQQYLIESRDLETGDFRSYIQDARNKPYILWQQTLENISGINAKIKITPINDFSSGKSSIFFLPLKNMNYIENANINRNPTTLVLAKFWHLFSPVSDEIINRSKIMYIYLDTNPDDVLLDKQLLNNNDWNQTTLGHWRIRNQLTYRWILYENTFQKLNEYNSLIDMTEEEIIFIRNILNSFNDIYMQYININQIDIGEGHIFKISVENPRDHLDSIIIYVMKGTRWQI